ncbi:MAG: nucleotidyltransferase domain-containing protein [Peptococcia bacterium]|jgi:predicted nucleotidyltransferase
MILEETEEIGELIKQIKGVAPVKKIYLFGSYAYGKPNKDSDIDLCIIINDNKTRKRDLIKNIRKSISEVAKKPVDILVYDQEQFLQRAKVKVTIEYKIYSEGVSIYG